MTHENSRFDVGMEVRSEVLGADHVERSLENASASLVNLGMLTALNRRHELGVLVA